MVSGETWINAHQNGKEEKQNQIETYASVWVSNKIVYGSGPVGMTSPSRVACGTARVCSSASIWGTINLIFLFSFPRPAPPFPPPDHSKLRLRLPHSIHIIVTVDGVGAVRSSAAVTTISGKSCWSCGERAKAYRFCSAISLFSISLVLHSMLDVCFQHTRYFYLRSLLWEASKGALNYITMRNIRKRRRKGRPIDNCQVESIPLK